MVYINESFYARQDAAESFMPISLKRICRDEQALSRMKNETLHELLKYDYANDKSFGEPYAKLGKDAYEFAASCWQTMIEKTRRGECPPDGYFNAGHILDICDELNAKKPSPLSVADLIMVEELVLRKFQELGERNIQKAAQQKAEQEAEKKQSEKPARQKRRNTVMLIDLNKASQDPQFVNSVREGLKIAYNENVANTPFSEREERVYRDFSLDVWSKIIATAHTSFGGVFCESDIIALSEDVNEIRKKSLTHLDDAMLEEAERRLIFIFKGLTNASPALQAYKPSKNIISLANICENKDTVLAIRKALLEKNHETISQYPEEIASQYESLVTECWKEMVERTTPQNSPYRKGFSSSDILTICELKNFQRSQPLPENSLVTIFNALNVGIKLLAQTNPNLRPETSKSTQIDL